MNYIFVLFIIILTADFIFDRWIDSLNAKSWSPELPENAKEIYDAGRYKLSRDYYLTNHRFSILTSTFSFGLILVVLFLNGFAWLDEWVRQYSQSPVWLAILFFGIIGIAADLLGVPFSLYKTFVIEEKFGFNKTTTRTFILDKLKGYILAAIIGGGILALLVTLYTTNGKYFPLLAWTAVSLFTVFTSMFYTSLILPLFNKLTTLPEGELKESIKSYCSKTGFTLKNIYVMDGSKRSTKANAFFSGFGHKKTIVLFDTLVNNYSKEELTAVLAHEVGHYKKKHTVKGMLLAILNGGIVFFILSLFLGNPALAKALGTGQSSFHLDILAFGILYSPLSELIGIDLTFTPKQSAITASSIEASAIVVTKGR